MSFSKEPTTTSLDKLSSSENAHNDKVRQYSEIISLARTKDPEIISRQNTVFQELPDIHRLAEQLYAHLQSQIVERGHVSSSREDMVGELFETLVKTENQLFDLSKESSPRRLGRFKTVTEKFVEFTHNPSRFNYNLRPDRQADISFLESDENDESGGESKNNTDLTLFGVGEAKSSNYLDYRCFSQFKRFHQSITQSAQFLNESSDTSEHGLPEFGVNGRKINVESKKRFHQYLIVCRDMEIRPDSVRNFILPKAIQNNQDPGLYEGDIDTFENMFKNGQIEIRKSAFSHRELSLLLKKIMDIVEMKIEASSQ